MKSIKNNLVAQHQNRNQKALPDKALQMSDTRLLSTGSPPTLQNLQTAVERHSCRTLHPPSTHHPRLETWWWQHHAVGVLFFSRDREAAQS